MLMLVGAYAEVCLAQVAESGGEEVCFCGAAHLLTGSVLISVRANQNPI
jgi:hypothetical protein